MWADRSMPASDSTSHPDDLIGWREGFVPMAEWQRELGLFSLAIHLKEFLYLTVRHMGMEME